MIKITSTICGTIVRPAVITTNENHVSNLEFGMSVKLPSRSEDDMPIIINVAIPDGRPEDIKDYIVGNRIIMDGSLLIRKDGGNYSFSLVDAKPQITYSVPAEDKIRGTIDFTGKVKEFTEKIDRRGMPYLVIQAYASEKVDRSAQGDTLLAKNGRWEHLWFRFKRFPKSGEGMDSILPSWLDNGVEVNIKGDIQLSTFNNYVNMGGRINEMYSVTSQDENEVTELL